MHVIVIGSLTQGITNIIGPFKTRDAAEEYAARNCLDNVDDFVIRPLEAKME